MVSYMTKQAGTRFIRNLVLLHLVLSAAFDTTDHSVELVPLVSFRKKPVCSCKRSSVIRIYSRRFGCSSRICGGSGSVPIVPFPSAWSNGCVVKTDTRCSQMTHWQLHHWHSTTTRLQLSRPYTFSQTCTSEVQTWLLSNKLKLTDDKTEVIRFSKSVHNSSALLPSSVTQ